MSMAASQQASEGGTGYGPIIVMGVCGCGKSSVGRRLADYLGCAFLEGDTVHPPANVEKMREGVPLNDSDRLPWLNDLAAKLREGGDIVVSCSALKRGYRQRLQDEAKRAVTFVFLQGSRDLIKARMADRKGHYMPVSLLESQLATLELPGKEENVITIDIDRPVEVIVTQALTCLAINAVRRKQVL